jgi:hypothetical protein
MTRLITGIFLCAFSLLAQGSAVNQTDGPPPSPWVKLLFYNGSSLLQYACYSPAQAPTTVYAIGATPALTSIVVVSNVGTVNLGATAQWWVGQRITVAGSTTAALNGTYTLSAVSGSTGTIATVGVPDATYNNAAMTISTTAPLLDSLRWSILVSTYVGTNLATNYWAASGVGVNSQLACSNRASY